MIDDLGGTLARLPEPQAPSALAATVMARVSRADRPSDAPRRSGAREWRAWLRIAAGLALVAGVIAAGWLTAGDLPDVTSSRIGSGGRMLAPTDGAALLLLAFALWLFLGGLFAPVARDAE